MLSLVVFSKIRQFVPIAFITEHKELNGGVGSKGRVLSFPKKAIRVAHSFRRNLSTDLYEIGGVQQFDWLKV